jgi:hypothetical protein
MIKAILKNSLCSLPETLRTVVSIINYMPDGTARTTCIEELCDALRPVRSVDILSVLSSIGNIPDEIRFRVLRDAILANDHELIKRIHVNNFSTFSLLQHIDALADPGTFGSTVHTVCSLFTREKEDIFGCIEAFSQQIHCSVQPTDPWVN